MSKWISFAIPFPRGVFMVEIWMINITKFFQWWKHSAWFWPSDPTIFVLIEHFNRGLLFLFCFVFAPVDGEVTSVPQSISTGLYYRTFPSKCVELCTKAPIICHVIEMTAACVSRCCAFIVNWTTVSKMFLLYKLVSIGLNCAIGDQVKWQM